jgi:hypothetical protein
VAQRRPEDTDSTADSPTFTENATRAWAAFIVAAADSTPDCPAFLAAATMALITPAAEPLTIDPSIFAAAILALRLALLLFNGG